MNKDSKEVVLEIARQVGKHEAQRLLVNEGVSTSTAQKLVYEKYKAEVGEMMRRAIARAADAAEKLKTA